MALIMERKATNAAGKLADIRVTWTELYSGAKTQDGRAALIDLSSCFNLPTHSALSIGCSGPHSEHHVLTTVHSC
jgi:hypothetical protein